MSPEFIEQVLLPLEVAQDFGNSPLTIAGKSVVCACPVCKETMHVRDKYFLCENKACSFRVGTAIDFIALMEDSYIKAVRTVFKAYPHKFPQGSSLDIEGIADQIRRRRAAFEFILVPEGDGQKLLNIGHAQSTSWLRNLKVNPAIQPTSVLMFSRRRMEHFLDACRLIKDSSVPAKLPATDDSFIVIPLFASPATIAQVIFFSWRRPKEFKQIRIGDYRFAFSGLLDMHPQCECLELNTNFIDALSANTVNAMARREAYNVMLWFDPRSDRHLWLPEKAMVSYNDEPVVNLSGFAELHNHSELNVAHREYQPMAWEEFCVKILVQTMKAEQGVGSSTDLTTASLRINDAIYHKTVHRLHELGKFEWAAAFERRQKTQLLVKEGKIEFYKNATGYHSIRADGLRVDLTNFLLEFEANVSFVDDRTLAHKGVVIFNDHRYPFIADENILNSVNNIETTVRQAEFAHAHLNEQGVLPTILEKGYMKGLLSHFKAVTSKLPRKEGINHLGWSARRNAFFTPYGKIMEEGVSVDVDTPNPALKFWDQMEVGPRIYNAQAPEHIDESVAEVVAIILGMIARSYMDFPLTPVVYAYTPETNAILRSIFRAAGQKNPVSFNLRDANALELKGLRGYPLLVTGAGKAQLEKVALPYIAMADSGLSIYHLPDETLFNQLLNYLPTLITMSVQHIISTQGAGLKMFHSVQNSTALSREGAALLQNMGVTWPETQPVFATMERLLNQVHFANADSVFSHDLQNQRITINLSRVKEINADDLWAELAQSGMRVSIEGSEFRVEALGMLRLLEAFYGQVPKMPQTNLPLNLLSALS